MRIALMVFILTACQTAVELPPGTARPATTPTATAMMMTSALPPTPPQADVIITLEGNTQTISVKVGQVIEILPPLSDREWQVSFDPDLLNPLTSPDKMRHPGSQGWFFRVVSAGSSDVMLTSVAPPCTSETPCPVTVARFIYTITAER